MGITDRSRAGISKAEKIRQEARQKVNQLESKAESSSKPNKEEIMKKINTLQAQAEDIYDDAAYSALTAQIRNLSSQL